MFALENHISIFDAVLILCLIITFLSVNHFCFITMVVVSLLFLLASFIPISVGTLTP